MTTARSVILAAHGAGDGSAANDFVRGLAAEVAERRPRIQVAAAFNLGAPGFAEALDASIGEDVTVVPLMTSNGWFVQERVPAMLQASRRHGEVPLRLTAPVGSVRRLVRTVRDIAVAAALESASGGDRVALLVVGHGTARRGSSGDSTRALAAEIAAAIEREAHAGPAHGPRPRIDVVAAFLDDAPRLEEIAARFEGQPRVVLPFLLGGGGHAGSDLRERVLGDPGADAACAAEAGVRFLPTLAELPGAVRDAVLDLIDWHDPTRRLRIGTRGSALARRQTELVRAALAGHGVSTSVVVLDTLGDRDQRTPIDAFPTDGPFTDDLELALTAGEIDLAVHSQKDLPLDHPDAPCLDTAVAALQTRGAVGEALVTTSGAALEDLAPGSRVGTCSPRRAAQLAARRPDLRAVPIRGPVDARLAAVARGEVDAAILALAGLERLGAADRVAQRLDLAQFLPEAGQGALAVTARCDDLPARAACAALDDPATRRAVEVERAIAAAIELRPDGSRRPDVVAAVHATVEITGTGCAATVHARAIALSTGAWQDAIVAAAGANEAVSRAVALLGRPEAEP